MASDVIRGYAITSQNDVIYCCNAILCGKKKLVNQLKRTKASLFEHCQGLDDELCKVYGGISVGYDLWCSIIAEISLFQ